MPESSNPVAGAPAETETQGTLGTFLQAAASADGPGTISAVDGYNGLQLVEIQKSNTGTTNVTLEGSFDQVVWYNAGYQKIDGVASPIREVTTIALNAGTVNHIYSIQDHYPFLRARMSGTVAPVSVSARIYAIPV